jgi:hypothetical protein
VELDLDRIENAAYDVGSVKVVQLKRIVESAYTAGRIFYCCSGGR